MFFTIDTYQNTLGEDVVVCTGTDYLHLFSLLKEIREEWQRLNKSTPTEMIFDMYYTNGNADNRFAKILFDGKQWDIDTCEVLPAKDVDARILNIQNKKRPF